MEEIGLDAFSDTKYGLADEIRNQLAMLWKEYALADDQTLTEAALKVKRNLAYNILVTSHICFRYLEFWSLGGLENFYNLLLNS